MATTSVPLMSDIEGGESEERPADIKNDFSYHNNVAGAPALIRKGFLKKVIRFVCDSRQNKIVKSTLQISYSSVT